MVLCKIIANCLLVIFSLVIPKSRKYVIVGGWYGQRYADNSRAFFEYLCDNKNKLKIERVFWFTKNKEIYKLLKKQKRDVLLGISLRSIYWHLRSKIHVIDQSTRDIIGVLSIRCIRINLWHGVPIKKIGNYITPNSASWRDKYKVSGMWNDSYILATSEYVGKLLTYAMGTREDHCLIASYPRNKELYKCLKEYDVQKCFCVFYLPTYRYGNDINPLLKIDLEKWNQVFKENNIKLYIKPHYASAAQWNVTSGLSNINILEASTDVYDLLPNTNLLITDYSSVYFDYMITGRPILFFPYDLYNYENVERGFLFSYESNTPGKKVNNTAELLESILYIKNNYQNYLNCYEQQYSKILNKINKYNNEENYSDLLKFWIQ